MKKIIGKCLLLLLLIFCLFAMLIYHPIQPYEKVTIVEKYYSSKPTEKLTGIKTKKKLSLSTNEKSETCAMGFNNNKVVIMDCQLFLNYNIGEKVKIKYKNSKLIDIRRK
ncbi:hypothetical protein [Heyndrickxia camelliae]|uniref:Uncharacterized protein n=1 Tax=Heyndrickxia camelliae TaxID=1707093 RepID=A0A2N3LLW1_9BACI|nr:hypothetical protein [Heyndrickxia camelliae]PKR85565.1 hypothetical protein CWO92_07580 [Heyndrickxia camelliae]